jgi:hypothetical protein
VQLVAIVEVQVAEAGHMWLAVGAHGCSSYNKDDGMDEVESAEVQLGGPSSSVLTNMRI